MTNRKRGDCPTTYGSTPEPLSQTVMFAFVTLELYHIDCEQTEGYVLLWLSWKQLSLLDRQATWGYFSSIPWRLGEI